MADVELPFFPSALNCLAWSFDGDLAIAAGEFVHILIPKRPKVGEAKKSTDPTLAVEPWHHVRFRVNTFREEEWPYLEPAGLGQLSLGEEQSTSIVTALAWSAPGLGHHGRCVLAILTSNLRVSLWESFAYPTEPQNWCRVCILNHALKEYSLKTSCSELVSRRKSRIRAVTWNPFPPQILDGWKRVDLLAIVNDDGDLYFLRLRRTTNTKLSVSKNPHCVAQVLLWLSTKDLPKPSEYRNVPVPTEPKAPRADRDAPSTKRQKPHAEIQRAQQARSHVGYTLAWSPWLAHGKFLRSIVMYKHAGLEIHQQVACTYPEITGQRNGVRCGELGLTLQGDASVQRTAADGPSVWMDNQDGLFYQLIGGGRQIVDLSFYMISAHEHEDGLLFREDGFSHVGDEDETDRWAARVKDCPPTGHPWEQISGMCAALSSDSRALIVCLTTHLSVFRSYRIDFPPAPHKEFRKGCFRDDRTSNLKRRMDGVRAHFAETKRLGAQTIMKAWGLASHGPLLASIISLHPSEMIEYTTTAQERSTVVFSEESLERIPPEEDSNPEQQHRDESIQTISFPWEWPRTVQPRGDAQLTHLQHMTFEPYHRPESLDRLSSFVSFNLYCARFLLGNNLRYFVDRIQHALVHQRYRGVLARLQWYEYAPLPTLEEKLELINAIIRITYGLDVTPQKFPLQPCCVCNGPLEWESLRMARCAEGHRWRRCAISFVAIQKPGIAKFCETCEAEVLNEYHFYESSGAGVVEEVDEILTDKSVLTVPCHAQDLLRSRPLCIFCGGKYVG